MVPLWLPNIKCRPWFEDWIHISTRRRRWWWWW